MRRSRLKSYLSSAVKVQRPYPLGPRRVYSRMQESLGGFGPGDAVDAHQPDELIACDELDRCVEFLVRLSDKCR